MKDILIGINKLVDEEYTRANTIKPAFSSDHEGYAVIQEEIEEAEDRIEAAKECKDLAWESIKVDYPNGAHEKIREMRYCLAYAAAELVRAIAMCDKFVASQEVRDECGN